MGFTLGVLQSSAYEQFYFGIWSVGVALVLALLSVLSILVSRFSSRPQGTGVGKLLPFASTPTAAAT